MLRTTVSVSLRALFLLSFFAPVGAAAQTSYADKLAAWKTLFPKEEVVAYSDKEVVRFELDTAQGEGRSPVRATVDHELVLVPVKDYIRFEDGLYYNDEIAIEDLKATSGDNKGVPVQKSCMSYSQQDIFHSDTRLCVVNFPFADKGKPVRLSYRNRFRDIKFLTSFYFQESRPAVEKVIEFFIPSWLEVDLREFNFAGRNIQKTSVSEGGFTKITYRMPEAVGYRSEPNAPNHALSYPHVIIVTKGYTSGGRRFPLFESVKDLYGWYSFVCRDIGNQPEALKSTVASLTAGKKTDEEKIEALFYWVQDKIRYIAFEDGIMGFKPDAAQNVLQKKYGDCKGKANLLKEMLKLAGYDARLTWIGTSDLPYDYTLPSLAVDNHMICTVLLNGKRYFLDGTEEYIALNDYAQRIQGKEVLIEDGKNFIVDKIPDFPPVRNKVRQVTKLRVQEGSLAGSSTVEYNGEARIGVQRFLAAMRTDVQNDAFSAFLRGGNDNINITQIRTPDLDNRMKPLLVSCVLEAGSQVTKGGNELYVVLDWNKEFGSLEFDEDRKNDYEFPHKYHYTVETELLIPDGYKVDYLPAAFKKTGAGYSFEGAYVKKEKSILYTKTIIISKPILRKTEFGEWNAFIRDVNKFYNDQIVLTR